MKVEDVELKYQNLGLKTNHSFDEPGKIYEPHRHGKVYLYSLSGSIKIKLDKEDWQTLQPGQEFVVNRGQFHEAIVGVEGWEYISAYDPEEAKKYGK